MSIFLTLTDPDLNISIAEEIERQQCPNKRGLVAVLSETDQLFVMEMTSSQDVHQQACSLRERSSLKSIENWQSTFLITHVIDGDREIWSTIQGKNTLSAMAEQRLKETLRKMYFANHVVAAKKIIMKLLSQDENDQIAAIGNLHKTYFDRIPGSDFEHFEKAFERILKQFPENNGVIFLQSLMEHYKQYTQTTEFENERLRIAKEKQMFITGQLQSMYDDDYELCDKTEPDSTHKYTFQNYLEAKNFSFGAQEIDIDRQFFRKYEIANLLPGNFHQQGSSASPDGLFSFKKNELEQKKMVGTQNNSATKEPEKVSGICSCILL